MEWQMDYKNFVDLKAVNELESLAEHPYGLTGSQSLTPQRIEKYRTSTCGFDLLYATQRVDDQTLEQLQNLADEAGLVDQFLDMKSGRIMNTIHGQESENRQVLHTACRDLFTNTPQAPQATSQAKQQLNSLQSFLHDLDNGVITNEQGKRFKTIVQVGIGGSDLGPRALYLALQAYCQNDKRACFIANIDPDDIVSVLAEIDLETTLFNIVSKSGTTMETLTNAQYIRQTLRKAGLEPSRHMLSVTGKGSPMDDPAHYLASFHMFDYIGGRYSVTSMVGAVTLGFVLGHDQFYEILQGCNAMDSAAEERTITKNIPLLLAMLGIWNRNFLGCPTVAVLPYSKALLRFPAHLQQCDMESNGKSITRFGSTVTWKTGPVLWGEPGTNGQHAFYQLLHQGTEIVPVEFIGFRQSQHGKDLLVNDTTSQQKLLANMLAQSLAMAQGEAHGHPNKFFAGNRANSVLIAEKLTPFTMGALLSLYESKIVFQGFCWNINSFDQEGVQLGKRLATSILSSMAHKTTWDNKKRDGQSIKTALLQAASLSE